MGVVAALLAATVFYLHHLIAGPLFLPMPAAVMPDARTDVAVVALSGDLGINFGMTGQVSRRLASAGVPVLTVNSHDYFTKRRTADEAAALVVEAIDRARKQTGATRVIVTGYSYGADMLQLALSRLTPAQREGIAAAVLVVPGRTLFMKIDWNERYDLIPPDGDSTATGKALDWLPVLCVSGAEETGSLCPLMTQANVTQAPLPGGHYLDHDPDRVAATVIGFVRSHAQ